MKSSSTIELELSTYFSCAHFYAQKIWDESKNKKIFGKCYSQYGHGHDYQLKISILVTAEESELAENVLRKALLEIREEFDHKHLNFDFLDFQRIIPTTENFALCLQQRIKKLRPELSFQRICLYETPNLFVELNH